MKSFPGTTPRRWHGCGSSQSRTSASLALMQSGSAEDQPQSGRYYYYYSYGTDGLKDNKWMTAALFGKATV